MPKVRRYHIVIDLENVPMQRLEDVKGIHDLLAVLPGIIGMNILHGPTVVVGAAHNPGVTGFVIIDFSHISVHTFTEDQTANIDIFSCKSFDREVAIEQVLKFFTVSREQADIQDVCWGKIYHKNMG